MRHVDIGAAELTRGFSCLWLAADVKVRRATAQRPTNFEVNMSLRICIVRNSSRTRVDCANWTP
jgi:hypothetical protein